MGQDRGDGELDPHRVLDNLTESWPRPVGI